MVKERLLLHACCAPCATHVMEVLSQSYTLIVFFYNPNIHPEDEYKKRLKDMVKLCEIKNTELLVPEYRPDIWLAHTRGMESLAEGGDRCRACFDHRLQKTAETAGIHGVNWVATTLTVSPHKNPKIINPIGKNAADSCGVQFLAADFKKKDGFKKSCELSREYGFYRQKYCGCIYSMGS